MELNKTIQDLKMEVETIKKTQRETTLEIETLGKKSGTIDASISNRRDGRENLRCRRFHREHGHNKENAKCKKILTQSIQEIEDTKRRPNLRIISIEERERRSPTQRARKYLQQNYRRKLTEHKERDAHEIQEAYK